MNGSNFGGWVKSSGAPGGGYPIEIFLIDSNKVEELLRADYDGGNVIKLNGTDEIKVKINAIPCVPATTASGCAYETYGKIVPGKYSIQMEVLGLRSNELQLTLLPE